MTGNNSTGVSDEIGWGLLQKKAQEVRAVRVFSALRDRGVEPILIKGLAAARHYPVSHPRLSIDMDIAVAADDYPAAYEVANSPTMGGFAIDLHFELRHLDTVAWTDLMANSETLVVQGGTIRVLRPEDHLRVLCVHWLTDGGGNKERLWDIYYSIANRSDDFDWDRFLSPVSERRQRWLICTVGLAHKYLGLDLQNTPIDEKALDLPQWLTNTVEREWNSETRAVPLETVIYDGTKLLKQIQKRLRPNPIWATVQMEGSFDAKTRFFYKVGNTLKRMLPSVRRIGYSLLQKSR